MERVEIFEKLNDVFREYFDDDSIIVTDATTAADIDDWDSLEHINLLVAIEREFGIKFTLGETSEMKNVGEMVTAISEHLK